MYTVMTNKVIKPGLIKYLIVIHIEVITYYKVLPVQSGAFYKLCKESMAVYEIKLSSVQGGFFIAIFWIFCLYGLASPSPTSYFSS